MTTPFKPRQFTPRSWKPLNEPLFGAVPPDEMEGVPTESDAEWYRMLVQITAQAIEHMVSQVNINHTTKRSVKFIGVPLGRHLARIETISTVFLEGEISPSQVGDQLSRLIKTLGLITYDPEPGPTHKWPMATRRISLDEARLIADDAFHGRVHTNPLT